MDVVKIIKACRQAGVSKLKYGELELEFGAGDADKLPRPPVDPAEPPTDQELKDAETQAIAEELIADQDEDLATMQIEDPARFEELLVQREFDFGVEAAHDK